MQRCAIVLFAVFAVSGPVLAADAPSELRGTSMVLQWKENRIQRHVGEPAFYTVAAAHNLSIYISNDGLVFTRLTNTTGAGSGKTEQVAGLTQADLTKRVPDFGDRSMTVYLPFKQGGMRRAVIEFDGPYKSCKARVAFAREDGAQQMLAFSPITKKMVEFKSATVNSETCTLRAGNIFGS
jgi:hypothetical protein